MRSPLAFLLPLPIPPLCPSLFSFTYLETLLAVIGSRSPWSQVTRKLTSPSSPLPIPSPKFPVPRLIVRLTTTTSCPRLLMSGTISMVHVLAVCPSCMSMMSNHAVCPCCISVLRVLAVYPCFMNILHEHAECPCSKSMLCVH
jgi:hypothetical protein